MPRRKTQFIQGNEYHIYGRGNRSQDIFLLNENYLFFLDRTATYLPESSVSFRTICLLPNQYHFSLSLLQPFDLSKAMMRLLLSYTRAFNKMFGRTGHVLESPFRSRFVDGIEQSDYLGRCIHRLPVETGLVHDPADWLYSSYRSFLSGVPSKDWISPGMNSPCLNSRQDLPRIDPIDTLTRFSDARSYERFVRNDWDAALWRMIDGKWIPFDDRSSPEFGFRSTTRMLGGGYVHGAPSS